MLQRIGWYFAMENTMNADSQAKQALKRKIPVTAIDEPGVVKFGKVAKQTSSGEVVMFQGRDPSYPDELNRLIQPLRCDVCHTPMNSLSSAKDHYESKPHDRSLNAWLQINYMDKGLEPPQIKRFLRKTTSAAKEGLVGPNAYHCEPCDLKLTSLVHAQEHYAGRKHRQVLTKLKQPSAVGYYDPNTGKWIRTASKITSTVANDGRFGIGEEFKRQILPATPDTTSDMYDTPILPNVAIAETQNEELLCQVCNVYVTSVTQMTLHESGAKHRRKLKLSSSEPSTATIVAKSVTKSIYGGLFVQEGTEQDIDWSMYRTPTGSFYCKTCNISMGHETALQQHLEGKKHLKRSTNEAQQEKQEPIKACITMK